VAHCTCAADLTAGSKVWRNSARVFSPDLASAGSDDRNVLDSDDLENQAQVHGCDVPVSDRRSLCVDPARSHQDGALLAMNQTFARHAQRKTLAHDMIDVRLQIGGDVVVVDRRADCNVIRSQQLGDELVRT
jgi:hypothetical protein